MRIIQFWARRPILANQVCFFLFRSFTNSTKILTDLILFLFQNFKKIFLMLMPARPMNMSVGNLLVFGRSHTLNCCKKANFLARPWVVSIYLNFAISNIFNVVDNHFSLFILALKSHAFFKLGLGECTRWF